MFDDLAAHFRENLVAAYLRCRDLRDDDTSGMSKDLQAATTAASALFHFREYLPAPHAMTYAAVEAACPDYALVADIANASKHQVLTRGSPKITKAESLAEVLIVTEYEDAEGTFKDARKQVVATLQDGSTRDVFELLTNVVNYWGTFLLGRGLISRFSPFPLPPLPGTYPVARREARASNLALMQGARFRHTFRLQRFNPGTGKPEPYPLPAGATITAKIYRPPSIEVTLTHASTGEVLRFAFQLTTDEARALQGIGTEDEKQEFFQKLTREHPERLERIPDQP